MIRLRKKLWEEIHSRVFALRLVGWRLLLVMGLDADARLTNCNCKMHADGHSFLFILMRHEARSLSLIPGLCGERD
jgi:hypothetical protein